MQQIIQSIRNSELNMVQVPDPFVKPGHMLIGFSYAGIVSFSRTVSDFVTLVSFLFPFYADELTTMAIRIRDGEDLTKAHRRHLYQLLANEKGIDHWKASVGYGLVQLGVGLSILFLKPFGIFVILLLLGAYFVVFCLVSRYVRSQVENRREDKKIIGYTL